MEQIDIVRIHLAHLARLERRPGGIYARERALRRLEHHLAPLDLLDVHVDHLRSFITRPSRRDVDRGPAGRRSEVNHVRGFYRWAQLEDLRPDDPTLRLERPHVPQRHPRPMANDHVNVALHQSPERIRPWFWFAAYAGLRACEVGPLRADDIRDGWLYVREQKGGDEGIVPFSPELVPILDGLPRSGYLFPHLGRGTAGPTSAAQVSKLANHWLRSQEIPDTFHALRHWAITRYHEGCGNLRETQEFARHRSSRTTELYTMVNRQRMLATIRAMPRAIDLGPALAFPLERAA